MGQIHYFQRYSQQENVHTNNTLLLLSRIQAHDPRKLRAVLENLLGGDGLETNGFSVGVEFSQQVRMGSAVPDGMLLQRSFRILIETKRRGDAFHTAQLRSHLQGFGNEDAKVLLLLAPTATSVELPEARAAGVQVLSRTFADIVGACRAAGLGDNVELREIIEDYDALCRDEGLISDEHRRMMVVAVGRTFRENLELGLYYAPVQRGFQPHRFLGLYQGKSVRAIGERENLVAANLINGKLHISNTESPVSPDQERRITSAMKLAPSHGYSVESGHRFFLVNRFVETHFRKTSSGGLFGKRYFDLHEELEFSDSATLPDVSEIASRLQDCTWD